MKSLTFLIVAGTLLILLHRQQWQLQETQRLLATANTQLASAIEGAHRAHLKGGDCMKRN